jgi:hypothetical protein
MLSTSPPPVTRNQAIDAYVELTGVTLVLPGDVCDQGGCPAAVLVVLFTLAGPLGFCLHHFRAHDEAFLAGDYAAFTLEELVRCLTR